MPPTRFLAVAILLGVLSSAPVTAQVLQAPYADSYTVADLGSPVGVPGPLGGLTFLPGDPNTIVIGGAANGSSGALYTLTAVRDGNQHITGFAGTAAPFAEGTYNDGGVAYGPGGVLFLTQYPINKLAQLRAGSTVVNKTIDLGPLGVVTSVGAINFVPDGFPGAGQTKLVSYNAYRWYTLTLAADDAGTWDVTAATYSVTTQGGPEGFIYVPQGSPLFPKPSMLVSEYQAGKVTAFEVDANGDPKPDTRTVFVDGLSGAEGAVIDPLTGDFLFSTFGGGNHVVAVRGFVAPPSTTSTTSTTITTTSTTSTSSTSSTTTTSSTSTTTTTTTLPALCDAAPECDDADVCNGVEACVGGRCAPAAAAQCRPTGRSLAAMSLYRADAVALIDVASHETQGTIAVGRHPWGVAWQPDGTRVWVTNRGGDSVSAIDPLGPAVAVTVPIGREPLGIAVHPDGTRVYVAEHGDDAVAVIDARTSTVVDGIRVGDGPAAVVVNPAGTRLYVGNYREGSVSVVDTTSGRVIDTVAVGGFPLGLAVAPGGAKLYVTDYGASQVTVIGTVSNSVTATVRVGRRPLGVAFTPDGTRAFVTCAGDDVVAVLDASTDRVIAKRPVPHMPLGVATDLASDEVWVASSNGAAVAIVDETATIDERVLDGTPVGFGQFIGTLPGDCPAQALSCDDADPFTDDGCDAGAGCDHTTLDGLDAVAAGAAAMTDVVEGVSPDGGALARQVLAQVPALGGVVAAAQVGNDADAVRAVRRSVLRLTKLVEAAARRGQLGMAGSALLDLARATRGRLRGAAHRRLGPRAASSAPDCVGCREGLD